MEWLKSPLINNAQVARQLGISPTLLKFKIEGTRGNRFTDADREKLETVRAGLAELLALSAELVTAD